ncbi:MAG TPA: ABC transporter permease [Thermoanaerobaculia bacterium]|nr:ABC transporter permease [Thermoanaerobaculia bacterium]
MWLSRDLRSALRSMVKNPAFHLAAIVILAVALGANMAVFSAVDRVLLRPLPYPQPGRLVDVSVLYAPVEGRPSREGFLDADSLAAWAERTRTFEQLAVYQPRALTVSGAGPAERVVGAAVSPSLFAVLGVAPAEGRLLRPEEARGAGEPVVVLSHELRQRQLDTGEAAVGSRVLLGGIPHTVVGVMPLGFGFPDDETDWWVPRAAAPTEAAGVLRLEFLPAVARLAAGATLDAAAAEGQALVRLRSGDGLTPVELATARVRVRSLKEKRVAEVRPALWTMWAAVTLVLVVACANLANLLLIRGTTRRRELAIRSAVGGGRGLLVRQMMTESVILALAGGAAGLLVAAAVHRLVARFAPQELLGTGGAVVDLRLFAFALGLAPATAIVFGLLPAWRSARGNLTQPLHGAIGEMPRERRSQAFLVIAEVALSLVLLVGASLLVRGFLRLVDVELGFAPDGVLTATLDPAAAGIDDAGRQRALFDALLDRMAAEPAVEAAGVVAHPPLAAGLTKVSVGVVGQPSARRLAVPQWTSPGYAEAVGLRLRAGRWLDEREHRSAAPVAVINESFASEHLPGLDPLRQQLELAGATVAVVGIVEDVRLLGFGSEPQPEVYASYRLAEEAGRRGAARLTLVLRTTGRPSGLIPVLRARVGEIEPGVAVDEAGALEDRLAISVAGPRFVALLAALFAAIGLLLTAAGLYGVLSYSVTVERRALGVRRALGATDGAVLRLVLGRGAVLIVIGVAIGLLASWGTTRFLGRLLFGLPADEPASYLTAMAIVCAVSFVACFLPAYRATRVDPLVALRAE